MYRKIEKVEKEQHLSNIEKKLLDQGFTFERKDFNRPWGAFWVINEIHAKEFIKRYFPDINPNDLITGQKLSPKILYVNPNARLSWQYHFRRREIWRVIEGPVAVIRSKNNDEKEMEIFNKGEQLELAQGERHRLIGLDNEGIVSEIWIHTHPDNPSDEEDIVRLQDDFKRK